MVRWEYLSKPREEASGLDPEAVHQLYSGPEMDRVLGLRSGANSVGAAIWPLLGGGLGTVAWQLPFGIYLVALPLGVLALAVVPDPHGQTDRSTTASPTERAPSEQATDGAGSPERSTGGSSLRSIGAGIRDIGSIVRDRPAFLPVYALYFGANAFIYVIVVFYPQLLTTIGVDSSAGIGLYLAANGAAGGVTATLYGRLKQRLGPHLLVLGALSLWIIAFALSVTVSSPAIAFVPVILFGFGIGLTFPSVFSWVESLSPPDRQGQFSSYLAMVGYIGQFCSPILFGRAVAPFGLRGVFAVATAIVSLAFVCLLGTIGARTVAKKNIE